MIFFTTAFFVFFLALIGVPILFGLAQFFGVYVIVHSRGQLVDEDDLIDALRSGQIRGAVMDVYQGELEGRQPRHELMELPQVFVTSHVSATGSSSAEAVRDLFRENLRRFLHDEPLINMVDRERGY